MHDGVPIMAIIQYFTMLHIVQVDSGGLQVDSWSPSGLQVDFLQIDIFLLVTCGVHVNST
jgi:hypothetical protein